MDFETKLDSFGFWDIFSLKNHFLTIHSRETDVGYRFQINMKNQVLRRLESQNINDDLFISKYPQNFILDTVILDFDSEEDKKIAKRDVNHAKNYLRANGLSSMIIDSTNKGYHLYIRISPTFFGFNQQLVDVNMKTGELISSKYKLSEYRHVRDNFIYFCRNLINAYEHEYKSLDINNLRASLKGIIRLPYSKHPSTEKRLKVAYNKLVEFQVPNTFQWNAYNLGLSMVCRDIEGEERKIKDWKQKKVDKKRDMVEANDLMDIMPGLFGGKVKRQSGYIVMQCPFHADNDPSCFVNKETYKCLSCDEAGNIFTLIKKGYLEYKDINK